MIPVLIPVKKPPRSKQRLASVLSTDERIQLAQAMVLDLVELLSRLPDAGPVTICGDDESTEALAKLAGVRYLSESALGASGLNSAVNSAAVLLASEGARELLVIHGDVPLLTHNELQKFLHAHAANSASGGDAVTLAPDRHRGGTNLLAWGPIGRFTAQYGAGSFGRHCRSATSLGARLVVCELEGAGLDVDEPADLYALSRAAPSGMARHTFAFLRQAAIEAKLSAWQASQQQGCL